MNETKDKVFYTVVGFKDIRKQADFDRDGYIKKSNAQRVARNLIAKGYLQVILRREEVWFRNELNEFSASTPIEKYTDNGCVILKN